MPVRVNGGVFTDQVLTGSLQHFRVVGADFTGAVGPTGQPITDSAAEIIFTYIADRATIVIMNPLTDPAGMSFALETNRAAWTAGELQTMINSLGTIGVDQVDVSNVTVEQVPYDLIEQGGGGGVTTFLGLTDTPNSYAGAANKTVSVNAGATGLTFTTPVPPGSTTFTGLTDTPSSYAGAAGKYVTVNSTTNGLVYTTLPTIPTNASFTLLGLSDTANTAVNNGYLQWNAAGTQVIYSTTIPTSAIPGLATVAITGSYNSLSNLPDLSIYAETADLATVATTGSYTDLTNQPNLSIYAETADLATVATSGLLTDLTDVNVTTPVDGQSLVYEAGEWINGTPVIPTLNDIGDVNAGGATTGFVLTWNGSEWVAAPGGTGGPIDLNSLTDVTVTAPASGQSLVYDGSLWINQDINYNDLTGAPVLATVATTGSYTDLINQPDLSIYAETADLATVATTGEYTDLLNTPDLSIYAETADLAPVAFTGSYNDLTNQPTIPTNASFTLTGLSDTAPAAVNNGYLQWDATGAQVDYVTDIPATDISGLATVATTGEYTDLLNTPDLSIYAETADLATVATTGSYTDLINQPDLSIYAETADLATVATTGEYTDLIGTPTIPDNADFSFIGLDDTPADYTGQAGKYVVVNPGADGLEFVTGPTPSVTNEVFYNYNGIITQTLSTVYATLLFNTSVETSTDVVYALGTATIQTAGWYTVAYQISTNGTTGSRTVTECKIQLNGTDILGSAAYTYNRNTTEGRATLSATVRVQLAVNDVLVIQGRGNPGPVVTLANACRLIITKDI